MIRKFVATVYLVKDRKLLLTFNEKVQNWVPVGGHVDENELPTETAIREAKEETSCDIELINNTQPIGSSGMVQPQAIQIDPLRADKENINFVYFGRITSGTVTEKTDEGLENRWFSLEEIDDSHLPSVREWGPRAIKELG